MFPLTFTPDFCDTLFSYNNHSTFWQIMGKLAAVDTTKETKLGTEYNIKGYPTIKYFRDGEFAFDVSSAREKDKIVEFMTDPKVRKSLQKKKDCASF